MGTANVLESTGREPGAGIASLLFSQRRLLYQAGFADQNLQPLFDSLGLGPLKRTATAGLTLTDDTMEVIPPSPQHPHGGVRLTMARPSTIPDGVTVAHGVAVVPDEGHRFPQSLKRFEIEAVYTLPDGPHTAADRWAAVLHARSGEPGTTEPSVANKQILVTLQSAWNATDPLGPRPGARMNTPVSPAQPGTGPWLPQWVYDALFPTTPFPPPAPPEPAPPIPVNPHEPVFSLILRVDREAGSGSATLYVRAVSEGGIIDPDPGFPVGYWESRPFTHPFMALTAPDATPNEIGAAGVLAAIARGAGPVAVTLRSFCIYSLEG